MIHRVWTNGGVAKSCGKWGFRFKDLWRQPDPASVEQESQKTGFGVVVTCILLDGVRRLLTNTSISALGSPAVPAAFLRERILGSDGGLLFAFSLATTAARTAFTGAPALTARRQRTTFGQDLHIIQGGLELRRPTGLIRFPGSVIGQTPLINNQCIEQFGSGGSDRLQRCRKREPQ
jgi:hypothetical protein